MAKLEKLNCETEDLWLFDCPGCECSHFVRTRGSGGPVWQWNSDLDKPTVTPSLLIKASRASHICHLFITDGKLQFLGDRTHKLAGQTVDMVELGA